MRAQTVPHQASDGVALVGADLEQDLRARAADSRTFRQQAADKIQSVGAAIQRQARLKTTHRERRQIGRGDIRQIRHQQIDLNAAVDQGISQIAFEERYVDADSSGISTRDVQGVAIDLTGVDVAFG